MSDTLHAVIASVQEGSRAQKEGLKAGDTIVSVNGHPVRGQLYQNDRQPAVPVPHYTVPRASRFFPCAAPYGIWNRSGLTNWE